MPKRNREKRFKERYHGRSKLFLNCRKHDTAHAFACVAWCATAISKVSWVPSITATAWFMSGADPRYEITLVTPAARKKFEGVVVGAWKPFVSLSLRRFVYRVPYTTDGLFAVGSSFSLSEGHQINHGLSSLVERFTSAGYFGPSSHSFEQGEQFEMVPCANSELMECTLKQELGEKRARKRKVEAREETKKRSGRRQEGNVEFSWNTENRRRWFRGKASTIETFGISVT